MTKARIRIDSWWFLKCCAFDTLLNVRLTETNSTVGFLLWEQRKSRYWVRFDQNSKAMSWRHTPKEQKPIGKRDQQLQSGKRIRLTSKTTVMHWKTARPFWCRHDMQHHRTLTNQDWIQTFGLVQDQLFWQRSEQILTFLIGRPRWQRFWFGVMTG